MGREQVKTPKMLALELAAKRDAISEEIDAIISTLTAPGAPGLTGNLVDAEGFPRSDIDVVGVRTQRNRLAVLRNDYKDVSSSLETALQAALPPVESTTVAAPAASSTAVRAVHFAQPGEITANGLSAPSASPVEPTTDVTGTASDRSRTPFAVVDSVSPGSPAADAQLMVGDRVVVFGAISLRALHSTAGAMRALPDTVRSHVNRPMDIIVHRGPSDAFDCLTLSITPRSWSGAGMLGCHVLPLHAEEDPRYRPDVATAVARR